MSENKKENTQSKNDEWEEGADNNVIEPSDNSGFDDVKLPILRKRRKSLSRSRRSRLIEQDGHKKVQPRRKVADETKMSSWGAFVGFGMWQYQITGPSEAFVSTVAANAFPTAGLDLTWWFFSYLGLDLKLYGGMLDFEFNAENGLSITPERFSTMHLDAAPSLMVHLWRGQGPYPSFWALRGGYAFSMASTENQAVNGLQTTLVPGWTFHAPTVGTMLRLSTGDSGLIGLLQVDVIPWGVYQESPDNPGAQVQPWGWALSTGLRYQTKSSFYGELGAETRGATAQFEGIGDRRSADGGPWQDGLVSNWKLHVALRLGSSF